MLEQEKSKDKSKPTLLELGNIGSRFFGFNIYYNDDVDDVPISIRELIPTISPVRLDLMATTKTTKSADPNSTPLSANFAKNVMIRHTQGCTTTSPTFKLNPGEQVSVTGPSSGTIYQTTASGQIRAIAILHYKTENGQAANVTKPFVFTRSTNVIHFKKLLPVMIYQKCQTAVGRNIVEIVGVFKL